MTSKQEGTPRLVLIPSLAASFGLMSGMISSGRLASLQFRAENAHRPPTTIRGWYSYRRAQNYKVILDGGKGALRGARKLGGWTAAFYLGLEGGNWILSNGLSALHMDGTQSACQTLSDVPLKGLSGILSGIALAEISGRVYRLSKNGQVARLACGAAIGLLLGLAEDLSVILPIWREHHERSTIHRGQTETQNRV